VVKPSFVPRPNVLGDPIAPGSLGLVSVIHFPGGSREGPPKFHSWYFLAGHMAGPGHGASALRCGHSHTVLAYGGEESSTLAEALLYVQMAPAFLLQSRQTCQGPDSLRQAGWPDSLRRQLGCGQELGVTVRFHEPARLML
jgi:hypothetical protein